MHRMLLLMAGGSRRRSVGNPSVNVGQICCSTIDDGVDEESGKPLSAAVAPVVAELWPVELGGSDDCFIFQMTKILTAFLLASLLYVGRYVASLWNIFKIF